MTDDCLLGVGSRSGSCTIICTSSAYAALAQEQNAASTASIQWKMQK